MDVDEVAVEAADVDMSQGNYIFFLFFQIYTFPLLFTYLSVEAINLDFWTVFF